MMQSYGFLLRIRSKLHSLTFNLAKFAANVANLAETKSWYGEGTERVRSWYGAGLVLVEELVNESHCIILLLIYNLGINLGGGDSCMPHQLAGCIDVCTKCKHHGSKGVPCSMEGDVLLYASVRCPYLDVSKNRLLASHAIEDKLVSVLLRQPFYSLA